jgi:hypothetical protein
MIGRRHQIVIEASTCVHLLLQHAYAYYNGGTRLNVAK